LRIVAIVATALAGIIGPTIAGVFGLLRQRREQAAARRMDTLSERRRLIYEALDQLTALETRFQPLGGAADPLSPHEMAIAFSSHRLQLRALFGPESDVASAYQECVNWIGVVLALKANGASEEEIKQAQEKANAARDRLVGVVGPHLVTR
jgi:hypothetical protein